MKQLSKGSRCVTDHLNSKFLRCNLLQNFHCPYHVPLGHLELSMFTVFPRFLTRQALEITFGTQTLQDKHRIFLDFRKHIVCGHLNSTSVHLSSANCAGIPNFSENIASP